MAWMGVPWTVQTSPAVGIPRKDLLTCLVAAEEGWTLILKGRRGLALVALGTSMHGEDTRSRWGTLGKGEERAVRKISFFRKGKS